VWRRVGEQTVSMCYEKGDRLVMNTDANARRRVRLAQEENEVFSRVSK
jgi:hypothetical protein